ncbi:MAG: hypothetical protein H0V01_09485 [Bacteroidetes bacterium]|nr:hypothetical protein [Bacteroidota bacterium]HET6243027.1 hypothetical protein [Bacteroidia bacterium]
MKTNFVLISLLFTSSLLGAQELVSKKGEAILPETGDWAIQVNAVPFLEYTGNFFSSAGKNTVSAQPISAYPFSIAVKYFQTEKTALRAKATININTITTNNFVVRDGQVAPIDPNETVRDSRKANNNMVFIGGGIEKRKGKTRLQGFYGAEILFMFSGGTRTNYTYGNTFSADNTTPTSTIDFNTGISALTSSRIISGRTGNSFGVGARGFIGAEYFIIPKLSLGMEYGWGMMYDFTGDGQNAFQEWDSVESTVIRTVSRTAGGSRFGLNTDISGGAINLTLHF